MEVRFFPADVCEMFAQNPPIRTFSAGGVGNAVICTPQRESSGLPMTGVTPGGGVVPFPPQTSLASAVCVAQKPCVRVAWALLLTNVQTTLSPKLALKFQLVGTPLELSGPAPVPPPVYPVQVKSVSVHPAGGPDSVIVLLLVVPLLPTFSTTPGGGVGGPGGKVAVEGAVGGVMVGFRVLSPVTGKVNVVVPVP